MYNEIGPDGAKALRKFKKLTQLYLFNNKITGKGLMHLAEMKDNFINILDVGTDDDK